MRAWLAVKQTGELFDEEVIPLNTLPGQFTLAQRSPSRLVPMLEHGDLRVWDSLAITEYLSEAFPEAGLWPADKKARAVARSACAEMHSGFGALRKGLPMDIRAPVSKTVPHGEIGGDVRRIVTLWTALRERYGEDGPFLFGPWSAADAFFAPIIIRFSTYSIKLQDVSEAYAEAVRAWPAVRQWIADATTEAEAGQAISR